MMTSPVQMATPERYCVTDPLYSPFVKVPTFALTQEISTFR
jgi:hypothetical protein